MAWDESSIPDLTGKVAVVTGGNAGIGFETVKQLALHGAKVYMGARSESRARQAVADMLTAHPSIPTDRIQWLPLDLSDLSNVNQAVKRLLANEMKLDILVNNAGIAATEFTTTKEGFELTMAVNHVGHFMLTTGLLPLLKAAAAEPGSDVRIVTVSSSGESFAPSDNTFSSAGDLNNACESGGIFAASKATFKRYGASKLANILFTRELQSRLNQDNANITALTLDPGPVATDGGMGILPGPLKPIMKIVMKSPDKGALTPLYCATAREVANDRKRFQGQFLSAPGKIAQGSERSRDGRLARALWHTTETALKDAGI